jgi:hypothetical protein
MKIISKARRVLRGDVDARTAASEALRQVNAKLEQRRERASLPSLNQQPARLREEFARVRAADLLAHFHSRTRPKFLPGFADLKRTAALQRDLFPAETARLIKDADRIVQKHCWPLLGFGEKCFGEPEINWNLDPLSRWQWPLEYHADIVLMRNDGSDARVVWELNRLAHFITLGRAFALTDDQKFSSEFVRQLQSWREQNPVGLGVNWNCAMEVALRAINLLATLNLFLRAPELDELALKEILALLDQHGAHIQRHLEFSHIATSNHYLADVTGLLWLGVMLPELQAAEAWREFGLRELRGEMDKQVLPDGVDYEASTGYHRLKIELFLYSFVLCHLNGIDIEEKYWTKLRAMIDYTAAYLRPDGRAPLIGDSDSGQVLPITRRAGDDHAYVAALGAAVFQEPRFKLADTPEELLWILGERGVRDYEALPSHPMSESRAFTDAGVYVLRQDDLYLYFNAGGIGVNGRGSHGHNDALSLEVAAGRTAFIVDPGSYLYTANLGERHLFRSTAYHSSVEIDGVEQNNTDKATPFVIGNEAQPTVISWETNDDFDQVVAEHYGYRRLAQPVVHRRTVFFAKEKRFWRVQDELLGEGSHDVRFRFHLRPGLEATAGADGSVVVCDKITGARLLIECQKPDGGRCFEAEPELESRFSSNDYGHKESSISVCWSARVTLPFSASFSLVPKDSATDFSL